MLFPYEDRLQIIKATTVLARNAVSKREEHAELDKTLKSLEKAILEYAIKNGDDENAAKQRVNLATKKRLADTESDPDEAVDILRGAAARARDRRRELEERDQATPPELPGQRLHPAPHLGVWTFTHSLLYVKCKQETPPDIGKDDMLYAGTFVYAGPGGLHPYYHNFDAGEHDYPAHTLASVPVMLGRHNYTATHLVAEEDFASSDNSKIIAIGITLLLDILIELGIQIGKASVSAWLKAQCPSNPPEAKALCERAADEAVDAIGKVAREGSNDLLGVIAEWLADALGPEVFPQMTSEAVIEWLPPAPPVVSGVRVIGSGTVNGQAPAFMSPGMSVALNVPLTRSGGGRYSHVMGFQVTGRGPR